jgi:hypothetical protein
MDCWTWPSWYWRFIIIAVAFGGATPLSGVSGRRRHKRRLDKACELHGAEHFDVEASLRLADNTTKLLRMPSLEWPYENATNFEQLVQIL